MVLGLAGRRIDAPGAEARFPADRVSAVASAIRQLLVSQHVTTIVASAACGADLLAMREAGALGLRRRVVLPSSREEFRAASVVDRNDPITNWGALFDETIASVFSHDDLLVLQWPTPSKAALAATNVAILEDAGRFGVDLNQRVCAALIWEGKSRGPNDLTAAFAKIAALRHLDVLEVRTLAP